MPRTALIIVDVQNDFISGSLALAQCPAGQDGAEVVPAINRLLSDHAFDQIVYTMDCHPSDHVSFNKWPSHCVAGTWGQELHSDLNQSPTIESDRIVIIKKGTDPKVDSYSAFWDNEHQFESELRAKLQKANIDTVLLCGLAFDICVYFTAMDAAEAGFATHIIEDCCRAINREESEEMIDKKTKLKQAGVGLIDSKDVPNFL